MTQQERMIKRMARQRKAYVQDQIRRMEHAAKYSQKRIVIAVRQALRENKRIALANERQNTNSG